MSLCINPECPQPGNPDTNLFCSSCGSELLLAGRYRVSRLLGEGGFGRIYEVTHKGIAKVLKILINDEPKAVELFEQEARVLTQLNHPGIPKGEENFTFFPRNHQTPLYCLVMEKISGLNLEEYQEKRGNRPIDEKLALDWLFQIVDILQAVHQENFFHRDIKPSNIILRPDGQLVLIDFGTARQVTDTYMFKQSAGNVTSMISPGYTPLEQIHGQAVPQSDFYALGRTFVYLLTGQEPSDLYDAGNDILMWRPHAPHISSELGDFLDSLMLRVYQRPKNTQVLWEKLEAINSELNPPRRSQKPDDSTVNRPQSSQAGGFGSLGIAVAGFFNQFQNSDPSPVEGVTLNSFDFDVVTLDKYGEIKKRRRHQAKYLTEDLGNGVGLDMVYIPGGRFLMGSPETEKGHSDDESPQHWVRVSPFFMGKFAVTQAQWRAVATLFQVYPSLNPQPSKFKGDTLPVEKVSWYEAMKFCAILSRLTGRNYRLPSEAEWEYACRAGTSTPFNFGETITTDVANYDGSCTYSSEPKGVYREQTTRVGSFGVANSFGLYDMHGNVWEWCADHWYPNYLSSPVDGSAWLSSINEYDHHSRLLRGGSWDIIPGICRSACRFSYIPADNTEVNIGFRVVCDVSMP
ncbi:MAG: SUMF1/EgtB/PvdO family nonheme iron enzyme [Moorea sp. SIOASIH]|uniref:bifunctional serine/threonine-protein kinase/formylglycine-generating enzyme family protein n=1 Tax=Moorena sp. SIOASIH TaxID=2607817 RepID=UPI0013BAC31C|nr:bifunctional serine/threonine-protein kinase/formylglycine-generating enzyme family protein [Moorena sp. SIOASIH]NEO40369.1 SUMF1/EgtB/PvdO family nonheme iron enzyme [Moorena sp. SIOASIH]